MINDLPVIRKIQNTWNRVCYCGKRNQQLVSYDAWAEYNQEEAHTIKEWCKVHCNDQWIEISGNFYFKHQEDALLFSLKWL
jgi:hypothetical protein